MALYVDLSPNLSLALKDNKINERDPLKLFNIWNHIQFLISCGNLIPFPLLALVTHDIFIPEQVMGPYIHLGELGQLWKQTEFKMKISC